MSLGTSYGNLAGMNVGGTQNPINYTTPSTSPPLGIVYPETGFYNTMGPIYLPRVYGSNLTTFEVGSSGTIAYTLFDVHSLDMSRDLSTNTVKIFTPNTGDSLEIRSDTAISLNTNDLKFTTTGPITYSVQGTLSSAAQDDITQAASNSLLLSATLGTNILKMDNTTKSAYWYSQCNLVMGASNDIIESANSNIAFTASNGSFTVSAAKGSNWFSLDKTSMVTLNTASNINLGASNSIIGRASSNFSLTTDVGKMTFVAGSNVSFTSQSNFSINTSSNFVVTSLNNITETASKNIQLQATTGSYTVTAGYGTTYFNMDMITSTATINTTSNITLGASNSINEFASKYITLTADSNSISLSANKGSNILFLDSATGNSTWATSAGDAIVYSSNNLIETAKTNMTLTASTGSVTLNAASGGSVINMDAVNNINTDVAGTYNLGSSNFVNIQANTAMALSTSSSNAYLKLNGNDGNLTMNAKNNYIMNVDNVNTVQISSNLVKINANLQVAGVIDSINVTQQNLLVQDREIFLSYNSNSYATMLDGQDTNDLSGIVIQGKSKNKDGVIMNSSDSNIYEKSFKWNYNTGVFNHQATGLAESYWEMKGGSFKLTKMNPTAFDAVDNHVTASNPVSFTFRINLNQELEIVKSFKKTNGESSTAIVAKFGRMISTL